MAFAVIAITSAPQREASAGTIHLNIVYAAIAITSSPIITRRNSIVSPLSVDDTRGKWKAHGV